MSEELKLSNFVKVRKNKNTSSTKKEIQQISGFKDFDLDNELKIPKSIEEEITQQVVEKVEKTNKKKKFGDLSFLFSISTEGNEEEIEQAEEIVHSISSDIPEEISVVEIAKTLETEVLNDIPDGDKITSIDDLKITTQTDKSGYIKTKVTVKGSPVLSKIASGIKQNTNGDVVHRAMDLRNIKNTNKNQLKNSEFKLFSKSYVFKSKSIERKYNRICISVDENKKSEVILFFQESANKAVYLLPFKSEKDYNFIVNIISDYFEIGFNATKLKLDNLFSEEGENPFTELAQIIAKTKQYKLKINDNRLLIGGKSQKNNWLGVIIEKEAEDSYSLYGISLIERDWKGTELSTQNVDMNYLKRNILQLLDEFYNFKDFSNVYDSLDEDNVIFMMYKKLRYKKLRQAFDKILEYREENENLGINIIKTVSRDEIDLTKDGKYEPEIIIGTSNKNKNWILSYSAVAIEGGDKRKGRDYITTDDYYEKEGVLDRSEYQNRKRTILKKQNNQRNYNSRPYMFTLDLVSNNGKVESFTDKEFENLLWKL